MPASITQIGTNFINEITEYFSESKGILSLTEIERDLTQLVQNCACDLASVYLTEVDERLLADKAGRRLAGYSVERRNDERRLLTSFGELVYARTYYSCKDGGYAYLVDEAVGLEGYARVSDGVSVALGSAACRMSYTRSSDTVINGAVSRQTVMHKVRGCAAVRAPEPPVKRRVHALHIDADEAHVTLRGGKKSIVPLISVYEGIETHGKRRSCKEIFHISEYGKSPDELWERALSEVEARYELENIAVYLHGDGAAWIKSGLEWFPKAKFVLDKYHKNKEITAMTAGLDSQLRKAYQTQIRYALAENDSRFLLELADSLAAELPQREEIIRKAAGYLNNQIEGVAVCATDPEANNGGCTEPHVSHVLSSRLSSRPMAWSKETLTKLAPMLAGSGVELSRESRKPQKLLLAKATRTAAKTFGKFRFDPDPSAIGALQPITTGKLSPLVRTLKAISAQRPI